jgi:hypothetical protein
MIEILPCCVILHECVLVSLLKDKLSCRTRGRDTGSALQAVIAEFIFHDRHVTVSVL